MAKKNRTFQDTVFTDLFGADRDCKENFISLYNAISGSDYKVEETPMERKRIEQSLIKTFDNDVSWKIGDKLIVLVEHQSTINNNMPFRCLEYVTRIYETMVDSNKRYYQKQITLPNPDFYVVYSGKKKTEEKKILKLSDSFYTKDSSKLELTVTVLDCSKSENLPLQKNCDIIKQYSRFIEIVNQNYDPENKLESFKTAIRQSISEDNLSEYLQRKSKEVINMLIAEYSYEDDIAAKQEEAFEDGQEAKAIESATNLLKMNLCSHEQIAQAINLPLEKVKELAAALKG